MIKQLFRVPDLKCVSCAMVVESIEYHLPGIKNIHASYHAQTLEVEYDEELLSEQAILDALAQKHYTAIPLAANK